MIFQTLDNKNECIGIFLNDELVYQNIPYNILTKTWNYSSHLKNKNIEYANLYCEGKTLEEVCPEHLKNELNEATKKMKAFLNCLYQSKVSTNENCFFDLVPRRFLFEHCQIKNKISNYVFEKYDKPIEYEFYKKFSQLLNEISFRKLNIDLKTIQNKIYKESIEAFYKKIANKQSYINYNMFGSITGRLTVKKESFPILTFPKSIRSILKPTNDWFISFDMNAAELRTAIALAGGQQPEGDFHSWSVSNVYNNNLNRAQAKETTTSWLYNSNSINAIKYDSVLSNIFDKNKLKSKYWVDNKVYTPYNRIIGSDEYHAISYLNQSTFIDLFHRQILKVYDYLQNKKSFVAFLIHDEFVLDINEDEKDEILNIINILQNTPYGIFPVSVKAGKNFGDMKKLNLKVDQCKQ